MNDHREPFLVRRKRARDFFANLLIIISLLFGAKFFDLYKILIDLIYWYY